MFCDVLPLLVGLAVGEGTFEAIENDPIELLALERREGIR
jgi:hypothetical protein